MQKPKPEDYRVSIAETFNINAAADMDCLLMEEDCNAEPGTQFIFEMENNREFYAECNDVLVAKAWLHNAKAVLSVLSRLHEAEDLILAFGGNDPYDHADATNKLRRLAERIKAGRAVQDG